MRIFFSFDHAPVIQGSVDELQGCLRQLRAFLDSDAPAIELEANTSGDPHPYNQFLSRLRFEKANRMIQALITEKDELIVRGKPELLKIYIRAFNCTAEHEHLHPELEFEDGTAFCDNSVFPYIQADNHYEADGYWRAT